MRESLWLQSKRVYIHSRWLNLGEYSYIGYTKYILQLSQSTSTKVTVIDKVHYTKWEDFKGFCLAKYTYHV